VVEVPDRGGSAVVGVIYSQLYYYCYIIIILLLSFFYIHTVHADGSSRPFTEKILLEGSVWIR
jgi:hypothetical protein